MPENKDPLKEKERFEILLAHVVNKIDVVAEGQGILVEKIEQIDKKVDTTKKDLEGMIMSTSKALHERIDKVDNKLEVMDNKINAMDNRIGSMDKKIDDVKIELKQDIGKVDKKIDKLDEKMTKRQDEIEEKINVVQQKVFMEHPPTVRKTMLYFRKKADIFLPEY